MYTLAESIPINEAMMQQHVLNHVKKVVIWKQEQILDKFFLMNQLQILDWPC